MNDQAPTPTYLMESPDEGHRLEAKTVPSAARRQLRLAGLAPGMHALDVGCGTGAVTRVMASIAGPGRVLGIDASDVRLSQASALAEKAGLALAFARGDACRLGLPDAAFDFSWSRFLFEYLPAPERALAEMVRVTRPGGIVAVADLDGQMQTFHPLDAVERARLTRLLAAVRATGFDPDVGRKLYGWFHATGLSDIRVHVRPHQVYAGGIPVSERPNWRRKIETVLPRLGAAAGGREWRDEGERLRALIERDDLFYYSTLVIVSGRVPMDG